MQQFAQKYPKVRLKLLESNPPQIAAMLVNGQADVGIATESLADTPGLASIPVYDWQHVAVMPRGHPLAKFQTTPGKLTLKDLARNPLVTYETQFAGRSKIDAAFGQSASSPRSCSRRSTPTSSRPTCTAAWAWASSPASRSITQRDGLVVLPCGHLFGTNVTRLAVKEGTYLRGFVYSFIEMLVPAWDKRRIEEAFRA